MKKVLSLFIAFLLVFALSACTDDTALLDLTDTVDALQTQLNASDVSIDDLKDAKDALQLEVNALTAELEAAKTGNTELDAEISDLQDDLDSAQLLLSTSIDALSGQLADVTAVFGAQLIAVADEFQLALDDSNASLADLEAALAESNAQIEDLLNDLAVFELPIIYGITEYTMSIYETLVPVLKSFDIQDGDLTSGVIQTSTGTFNQTGTYGVDFEVTDSQGHTGYLTVSVVVSAPALAEDDMANYPSGVDLSKLDIENKGRIFSALENYLLENVYAGVPLYTGATRVMYSDRVSLFSNDFNGVMGFGIEFSEFTEDDSNVLMYGSTMGEVDEYTWRASFTTDPTSLNPWTADDSNSSDFIDLFTGSLYKFYFDASKTGYEINPEQASGDPVPVDPETINGKVYSRVWEISLMEDLEWAFHPDTDLAPLAALNADYAELDASDYLWTWQYGMDNTWFRTLSGGGDFITSGIKNAAEYLAGTADWADVGMKNVDGKIQLTFNTDKSMFDIKYSLAGSWTPINEELYMSLTPTEATSEYGLSPETVASSGRQVFETWTSGQFLSFVQNDLYPHKELHHYTGYQYRYIETDEQRFEEFLAGRLDSSSIPSARIDEFVSDPRVKVSPANTTWRLNINSFGTEANRDAYIAQYPEFGLADDFVPEPILQYLEMRQALYFGFDRYEAAVNVVKTYLPAFTYYASTYFLDAESGISVRGTVDGAATVETFGAGTYGYVPDAAVAYFKSAVEKGIADGYYEAGTVDNYTTIEMGLIYASSGNTGAQNMIAELVQQYETLLVDDVNFVNIDIEVSDVEFPTNYYSFQIIANCDMGIGGISGSLMDAPSFLDVFNDNNVSGFTMSWGIDTHSVVLPVTYNNLEGDTVSEYWSYNALVAALNGKEYVLNGELQTVFDNLDGLIAAYTDMAGSTVESSSDGSDLYGYITGQTVEELVAAEGFDDAFAMVVVPAEGADLLFVVSEIEGGFELVDQFALATDAETAIGTHSGYASRLMTVVGPMTDAETVADAYLAGLGTGYTTVAEWADYAGAPAEFVEVWACNWDTWSDAYVVLHIGDYYIGYLWL